LKRKAVKQKVRRRTSKGVKFKVLEGRRETKLQMKIVAARRTTPRLNRKVKRLKNGGLNNG
jgi:hypothetical protein